MDIDIDDPDFWTKWAQKAAVDFDDMKKVRPVIALQVKERRRYENGSKREKAGDDKEQWKLGMM